MTVAQMMGLTMLAKRGEAAMRHINGVGVIIGEIKGDKGAKQTTPFRMTEEDLRRIASMLTPEQTRVANALQKFMAERGAEWGNEISLARFGYKFYTEGEHYYPIRTAESSRNMSDKDPSNSMFRLLNLSASKSLNPKANNALVVDDIFDVFSEHTADMARLNAYGLPLLDAIKWFNYRQLLPGDNGTLTERNLKASMDTAFGKAAGQYFRQLIRDINGVREGGDRGVGDFSKLISNYKVAAVGANLRVAVLQPTSYLRARHVLDEKYLAAALQFHKYSGKKAYQEALQYSGTAVWKSLGYYDTDISRGLGKQIIQDETLMDKVKEKSMFLAEKGDKVTWARLWIAAKLQTKAQHPELAGEELCRATADLFREVIYGTQVMDCTLTRSTIMRGNNIYDKTISTFGAEPTLSYNILMDAATQYEIDRRKYGKREAIRRNKAQIGQAIVTYLVSSVGSAVAGSIFDAIRDDDDYETFLQKFWQAFMGENGFFSGNLGQDLSIVGKIPAVKDIISALQGDTGNSLSTAAASSISQVYAIWKETIQLQNGDLASPTKTTYYGNMTTWGKIYKTIRAFSQVSGMAVSNALRDVNALVNTFGGDWKFYDPGEKSSIKRAYTDGLISEEEATGYLRELAEDTKEQEKLMREFARWKCEVEEGFPYDTIKPKFKKGKLTRQEAMRLLQEYGSKTEKQANKALDDWQAEQDEEDTE